jgi:hypothetical protein
MSFHNISVTASSATLTLVSGHNGGSLQTFDVEMKSHPDQDFVVVKKDLADPGFGKNINVTISNLKETSTYTFRIVAKNHFNGASLVYSKDITIETLGMH